MRGVFQGLSRDIFELAVVFIFFAFSFLFFLLGIIGFLHLGWLLLACGHLSIILGGLLHIRCDLSRLIVGLELVHYVHKSLELPIVDICTTLCK